MQNKPSKETVATSAADTDKITKSIKPSKEALATCPICCENKPLVSLTTCSHQSCQDCISQWIQKAESTGQSALPGCPFCRVGLAHNDIGAIIGRTFHPKAASTPLEVEVDELTRQFIETQTRPCPGCGAYIAKEDGTCNKMECLCGFRFCFSCGSYRARCHCSPFGHMFEDNWLESYAKRHGTDDCDREKSSWGSVARGAIDSSGDQRRELLRHSRERTDLVDSLSHLDEEDPWTDSHENSRGDSQAGWEEDFKDIDATVRAIEQSQRRRNPRGRATDGTSFYVPNG